MMFEEAGHAEASGKRLSLERIEEAARCIDPVFLGSPQYEAEVLGDELGLRLVCKVERMRRLGAEVRLEGEDFDEAKAAARALAESEGWRFVEDGREVEISEGAGKIALELCRWPEPFDALLVPLGNGALLSGVGTWMKAHAPSTAVIGVCAEGAPAMALSLREGVVRTTEKADTIADGIAVRVPVEEALADLAGVVDDGTMVRAMRLLFWEMGLVVEPAGAAGIAALLAYRERFAGALVATPLCGGNLTGQHIRRWLLEDASGNELKPSDG